MSSSTIVKIRNIKATKPKISLAIIIVITLSMIILLPPSLKAQAYSIIIDNNVDADSNVDSVANIGSDGTTSYIDVQALDGSDQEINESDTVGGGSESIRYKLATEEDALVEDIAYYDGSIGVMPHGIHYGEETFQSNWDDIWYPDTERMDDTIRPSYAGDESIEYYYAISDRFRANLYKNRVELVGNRWNLTQTMGRIGLLDWDTKDYTVISSASPPSAFEYQSEQNRVKYSDVWSLTDLYIGYNYSDLKEVIVARGTPAQFPSDPYPSGSTYLVVENIITDWNVDLYDDGGNISASKDITGLLRMYDKVSSKLLAFMPTGKAWADFPTSTEETDVKIRVNITESGAISIFTGINYTIFTHPARTGNVFIDPSWVVGGFESNWNDNCDFVNAGYYEPFDAVMVNMSFSSGNVTSHIVEADQRWYRIKFVADLGSGSIDIYFNSSSDNGSSDAFEMNLVQSSAVSGTNYILPVANQEKYGSWLFDMSRIDNYPRLYNVTLFNDKIIEDFVDLDTSDVDSTADLGTLTDFNNMKASDSSYANISEVGGVLESDWGDNDAQGTSAPAPHCRAMGGTFSEGSGYEVTEIYVYAAGTGNLRLAVYQGGALDDPNGATLVWDAGEVTIGSVGWYGITGGSGSLTNNQPTWLVWRANDTTQNVYYDTSFDTGSDFQSGEGRFNFELGGLTDDEAIAYEASVGAGASSSAFWYSIYMVVESPDSDFQMDQEVQFTDVLYFLDTEILSIETGAFGGSEDINVTYWDGDSWEAIASDLTASTWNNYTVSLTSSTFTIKFGGSTTSSDSTEDYWLIDSVLLATSGEGRNCTYVDNMDSDIDSEIDQGTVTNFVNMQDINNPMAILTETAPSGEIEKIGIDTDSDADDTPLSFSHTLVSGTDRIIIGIAGCESYLDGTASDITATYGGEAMTEAVSQRAGVGTFYDITILYILEADLPDDGANTIIFTYSGAPNDVHGWVGEYQNVDQSAPEATDGTEWTSGLTVANTISPSNDAWVISGVGWGNVLSSTHGQSQVEVLDFQDGTSAMAIAELRGANGETSLDSTASGTVNRGGRVSASFIPSSGSIDYRMVQEFQFVDLYYQLTYEYVSIYVGTTDSEDIWVQAWNSTSSAWVNLTTDLTADSWNNFSITDYLTSSTFYVRFVDGLQSSDTTTDDSWEIDALIVCVWEAPSINYELEWEHQVENLDIFKDGFVITVYGFSSSSTEEFEIQVWNATASSWSSALSMSINETEMWYNQTVDMRYVDIGAEIITWRYKDTYNTGDSVEDRLSIDYAGVRAYNITIYGLPATHNSLSFSPDDNYHALTDSPLSFVVESGEVYSLQIKGIDGTGSPVSGGYIYWNTVDNSGTSTQLTTSWVDFLTLQSLGNNTHNVYLWINYNWQAGDPPIEDIIPTYTLNITIS